MRKSNGEIAAEIRERICLLGGADEIILHEGQLATEFGVSRTPIRQVLQMLAYENLVETRSGVGTIATPLLIDRRESDFRAFRAILAACVHCPADNASVPGLALDRLRDARRLLAASTGADPTLVKTVAAYLEAMLLLVGDHIVATALRSAFWRHVRWCLHPRHGNMAEARDHFAEAIADAVPLAEAGDPKALLARLAALDVGGGEGWYLG